MKVQSFMATRNRDIKLLNYLHNELELSNADIAVALRHRELENGPLPMLLWQYGLVDLEQLGKIFDWLAEHS
ncbi:conserved hypothetical protein [Nostoc punctiforme PCC 73102]|uniref:DUF2949 domain-containing protein n=2 Tax=Nostoc TaxID=1177 RepID=B2J700_NOSP7|nr:conserved hypothetical protein [Nostoc punctiforme PCC 73102]